jgi:putative toxin-antitoxin system antitoxin component (TIGR02293 family)
MEKPASCRPSRAGLRHGASHVAEPISIAQVRAGLPVSVVGRFAAEVGVDHARLAELLGISLRTLQRKSDGAERLGPAASDRLARLRRLQLLAVHVLGTREKAAGWLTAPNRALEGESPLSLLDTDTGAERVQYELRQIEFGMPF